VTTDNLDLQAFLGDFLTEAADHLAILDDVLLELERLVAGGEGVGGELVNVLFRSIHTLKGMAGMMGFGTFTGLAHHLEQVFDEVRQATRQLGEADLPAVFDGFDALKRLHAHIAQSGGEIGLDVSAAEAAVAALTSQAAPAPTPREATAAPSWLDRLDDHDQMDALVAAAKGQHLYELRVTAARDFTDVGVGEWLEGVAMIGAVLGAWAPDGRAIAADALPAAHLAAFELLLATEADIASVHDCTGLPGPAVARAVLPWQQPAAPAPAAAPVAPAAPVGAAASPKSAPATAERSSSIRVETARLDRLMELVGELVIHHTRLARLNTEFTAVLESPGALEAHRERLEAMAADFDEAMQSMARVSDDMQESTMKVRMVPVNSLFNRFPRILRDLARECGKSARLAIVGGETELDKTVIEQIGDPLIHLLRNAVDHGLESPSDRLAAGKPAEGVVTLSAAQRGHHITITVAEDGRGIDRQKVLAKARAQGLVGEGDNPSDQEVYQLIFRPGFSTAAAVTNISGRGVGMDVVQQNIQKLGGTIQVISEAGAGTRFVIKLPLTLAIAKALLVRSGPHTYAVPIASVEETLRLGRQEMRTIHEQAVVQVRGHVLPLFHLSALFQLAGDRGDRAHEPTVIVGDGEQRLALVVDELVGQQDVVVKSLGDYLGQVPGIGGATILGDGRVALILDVPTLLATHGAGVAGASSSSRHPA
jgi:two-component system chemotaxis sensor kinase CheA